MILEFNTVYGQVPENLINDTRKQIISLIHANKKIHRAEVTLKEDKIFSPAENKVCCIKLGAAGDNIVIHTRGGNFESAIAEAINDLRSKIKQQAKRQKYAAMVA